MLPRGLLGHSWPTLLTFCYSFHYLNWLESSFSLSFSSLWKLPMVSHQQPTHRTTLLNTPLVSFLSPKPSSSSDSYLPLPPHPSSFLTGSFIKECLYAMWQGCNFDCLYHPLVQICQFECYWLVTSVHHHNNHLLIGWRSEEGCALQCRVDHFIGDLVGPSRDKLAACSCRRKNTQLLRDRVWASPPLPCTNCVRNVAAMATTFWLQQTYPRTDCWNYSMATVGIMPTSTSK